MNKYLYSPRFRSALILSIFISGYFHTPSYSVELSGYLEAEARLFANAPLYEGQENNSASVAIVTEIYQELGHNSSFTATPFARLDSADSNRTHFDLREFFFLLHGEWWEIRAGVDKVFWGVTESVHLVDIVNQTDTLESFDGEEKFGQPMLMLSFTGDGKGMNLFILPFFRERNFAGEGGRLRSKLLIDGNASAYESADRENSVDFAARFNHTSGPLDLGLTYFKGTGREPAYRLKVNEFGFPALDVSGRLGLFPYYEQISQTGLDMLLVLDAWLLKMESIYRTGQSDRNGEKKDYGSSVLGFEYTLYGIAGSGADVGILSEWIYDERGENAVTSFNNDLMAGMRFSLNDVSSSSLLFGLIYDYKSGASFFTLEGSRRLTDHFKLEIQSIYFVYSPESDLAWGMRSDSLLEARLAYYF